MNISKNQLRFSKEDFTPAVGVGLPGNWEKMRPVAARPAMVRNGLGRSTAYGFRKAPLSCLYYISLRPLLQRSEEHTSELQSRENLVCRLLLEKKKKNKQET